MPFDSSIPPDTTFGQDMDKFIGKYCEGSQELAMLELQLIVLKAERATMEECYKTFPASISSYLS